MRNIIEKLATSLGRKDDVPNQKSAKGAVKNACGKQSRNPLSAIG